MFESPPKFISWSPNLQYDRICSWNLGEEIRVRYSDEGGVLIIGSVSFEKVFRELSHFSWRYIKKIAICRPGKEFSPRTNWSTLAVDSTVCRTVRKKFLSFKISNLWLFWYNNWYLDITTYSLIELSCEYIKISKYLRI